MRKSIWFMKPQGSGWKFQKYVSCHHLVFVYVLRGMPKGANDWWDRLATQPSCLGMWDWAYTLLETNSSPMKIPIFPGKYHKNGGFSMAILVYRSVFDKHVFLPLDLWWSQVRNLSFLCFAYPLTLPLAVLGQNGRHDVWVRPRNRCKNTFKLCTWQT